MEDSSFTLRKVAEVERVLCAAPAYLARRGAPKNPRDLSRHDCLLLRFPGSQQFRWTLDFDGEVDLRADRGPGRRRRRRRADPMGARRPRHRAEAAVRSRRPISPTGALVEVLPEARPQPVTLGILYPTRRMLPPRTKSFIDLAVEELRRHLNAQWGCWARGGGVRRRLKLTHLRGNRLRLSLRAKRVPLPPHVLRPWIPASQG